MAQIINDMDFGSYLGRQLGQGLSRGLGSLANYKLQDIINRQQKNEKRAAYEQFKPGLGWLAEAPEQVQKTYMENYLNENPDVLQGNQQQSPENLAQMMGQVPGMQRQQQVIDQLSSLFNRTEPMNAGQNVANALQGMVGMGMPQMGQGAQQLQAMQQQGMFNPQQIQGQMQQPMQENHGQAMDRAANGRRYTRRERFEIERDQRKADLRERDRLEKQYAPQIHEMNNQYKGVIDQTRSLDRMEQLVKKGKLPSPKLASGLNFLADGATIYTPLGGVHLSGLNFKSALGKNAEEFEKLSNDFIKNAKNVFGSRITDNDLKAFMSTVPNLMMTDKGKLRVIRNMRLYNEGIKARHDAMRQILKENNGRPPRNMELLIEDKASGRLNQIAKDFITKPAKVPRGIVGETFHKIDKFWESLPGADL